MSASASQPTEAMGHGVMGTRSRCWSVYPIKAEVPPGTELCPSEVDRLGRLGAAVLLWSGHMCARDRGVWGGGWRVAGSGWGWLHALS